MSKFIKKDILANNLKLHTEAFGKSTNPACLLIAGKMSTARFWTYEFCEYLSNQGYFVIRYDHRDVGESSEIDWEKEPYDMSDLAKDAIAILNGYGIEKAHFIGNSMGGWIAQKIAVDFPEKVQSLIIISAGPIEVTKDWETPLSNEEKKIIDTTMKLFSSRKDGKNLEETIQNFLPIWKYCNGDIPLDEEMAKKFTNDFLTRTKNKNFINHEKMMQNFLSSMKKTKNLEKIGKPVLVIYGDKDFVVLPRHEKSVADSIPKSKLIMIKGMGHTFFNQELEMKIETYIVDFLKTLKK